MSKSTFGNIRKLPSGNYQARYKIQNTTINAPTTFPTKTMARQWLKAEEARIALDAINGVLPQALDPSEETQRKAAQQKTIGEYAIIWLGDAERTGFSPDTVRTYLSRWKKHLKPFFNDLKPIEVDKQVLTRWDLETEWQSPGVRKNTFLTLSSLFQWLVDQEIIEENPVQKVKVKTPAAAKKHTPVATVEQIDLIRDAMPPQLRITIDLGVWCAMRFGEVAGLERGDIDLDAGTISIARATHRGVGGVESVGALKTRASRRVITMPPAVVERMREHLDRWVDPSLKAPVVYYLKDRSRRLSNKHLHVYYDPAVDAAGLPGYRFHDLRHTALTMAARAGATLEELKARAGHSSNDVAMLYQTATLERDRLLAERLGG